MRGHNAGFVPAALLGAATTAACFSGYDVFQRGVPTTGAGGALEGGGGAGGGVQGGGGAGGSPPDGLWARSIPASRSQAFAVAADAEGNVFVTGWAVGLADQDGAPSCPGWAAFVEKIAPSGKTQWRRCFAGNASGQEIAVDANGDVYVAVYAQGPVTFGDQSYSANSPDGFVVKLRAEDGTPAWSTQVGGAGPTWISGIVASGDAVVIAGGAAQKLDWIKNPDWGDQLYVARLDPKTGEQRWVAAFGGKYSQDAGPIPALADKALSGRVAVMPDSGGNVHEVYVVGSFTKEFSYRDAAGVVQTIGHSVGQAFDTYLLRLDRDGNVRGHIAWGNGTPALGRAVSVDLTTGHVFAAGTFEGELALRETLVAKGKDALVVELDTEAETGFNFVRATAIGGEGAQDVFAIAVDGGTALVAGNFEQELSVGGHAAPGGGYVALIGQESSAATVIGSAATTTVFGVAFAADAIPTCGSFRGTVTIGDDTLETTSEAGFVALLAPPEP